MDTEYIAGYTLGRMGFACPPFVSDKFQAGYNDGCASLSDAP